jgi:hypothetical protein
LKDLIKKPGIVSVAAVAEMIAFAVITIMKLAMPGASDGWIPSDFWDRIILMLALPLNMILVPILLYRTQNAESEAKSKAFLCALGACLLGLLFLQPYDWYRLPQIRKAEMLSIAEQPALYDDFLLELETTPLEEFRNIGVYDYEEGQSWTTPREFEITEELRAQILDILKTAPAEYFDSSTRSSYGGALSLNIHPGGYWAHFEYNYEDSFCKEFGVEGETILSLYPPGGGPRYYILDNSYVDRIVEILPDFHIDFSEQIDEEEARNQLALYEQLLDDFENETLYDFEVLSRREPHASKYTVSEDLRDRLAGVIKEVPVEHYYYKRLKPEFVNTGIWQGVSFYRERDGEKQFCRISLDYSFEAESDVDITLPAPGRAVITVFLMDEAEFYLVTDNRYMDEIFELLSNFESFPY